MAKCRNCKTKKIDDSKSYLNELGLFCSRLCYITFRKNHPELINPKKEKGISELF